MPGGLQAHRWTILYTLYFAREGKQRSQIVRVIVSILVALLWTESLFFVACAEVDDTGCGYLLILAGVVG